MTTPYRPSYTALVAALRTEFDPLALESLDHQMREHRTNHSSLGVLSQAVHDANDVTYDPGEPAHPAVREWFTKGFARGFAR